MPIGRFRYIASWGERCRFARNSVWAFNLAPAFPRRALPLCPQLCMGISPKRYTEIGPLREDTKVKNALDDVAGNVWQALEPRTSGGTP